jgi:hypothetical protein
MLGAGHVLSKATGGAGGEEGSRRRCSSNHVSRHYGTAPVRWHDMG